ncbi:hypothetical protein BU23DRAFT_597903 [Bimuria novae-zelandiae CBS 107.79]|uniref:Uncharacterized protein n=1 Tax=Bimuria novae-zelandiae CBS 107.79 TaxID=1447943 RepID=A0A6A5VE50_9PLEO|nr:hypothetical protein BU23DRAFT_597903 [Bimuria novae-zelandiae CBS 107.79]
MVAVPSSPPRASSPVPGPSYNLEIEYTLRVNKAIKVKDMAICNRREFVILDLDDMVEQMVRNPLSEIDGRDYRTLVIGVAFRAGRRTKTSRSAFKHKTLANFIESRDVLVRDMDRAVESLRGCDILEIRVDVKASQYSALSHYQRASASWQSYDLVTADGGVAGVSMTGGFATRPSVATMDTSARFLSLRSNTGN